MEQKKYAWSVKDSSVLYSKLYYSEKFIIENKDRIIWKYYHYSYTDFSYDTLEKLKDYIDWDKYLTFYARHFPQKILEKYINKLDPFYILNYCEYNEEFLIQHQNYLGWDNIFKYAKFSEEFVKKYKYNLDWSNPHIKKYIHLKPSFLEKIFMRMKKIVSLHCKSHGIVMSFIH